MKVQKTEDMRLERKKALLALFRQEGRFPAWRGPFVFLKDIWNGRLPLWFQFWVLYCGGELLFILATAFLLDFIVLLMDDAGGLPSEVLLALLGYLVLYAIYWVLSTVGAWRSAERYTGWQVWARLVNVKIVCSVIGVIVWLLNPSS